eukprot:767813-Hanusia_phi.AAC.4
MKHPKSPPASQGRLAVVQEWLLSAAEVTLRGEEHGAMAQMALEAWRELRDLSAHNAQPFLERQDIPDLLKSLQEI